MKRMLHQSEDDMRLYNNLKEFRNLVRMCIIDTELDLSMMSHLDVDLQHRRLSVRSGAS